MLPISPQAKLLIQVLVIAMAFGAGWTVQGWRLGEKAAKKELNNQIRVTEVVRESRQTESESTQVSQEAGQQHEEAKQEIKQADQATQTEVINHVQSDSAGSCSLSNRWVYIDTASARGLPPADATATKPDDSPSGITDLEAIPIFRERNIICREEIEKLRALQLYVQGQQKLLGIKGTQDE